MRHAYKWAKKMYGITVDPKEIDDKVALVQKTIRGKTNSYRLKGDEVLSKFSIQQGRFKTI